MRSTLFLFLSSSFIDKLAYNFSFVTLSFKVSWISLRLIGCECSILALWALSFSSWRFFISMEPLCPCFNILPWLVSTICSLATLSAFSVSMRSNSYPVTRSGSPCLISKYRGTLHWPKCIRVSAFQASMVSALVSKKLQKLSWIFWIGPFQVYSLALTSLIIDDIFRFYNIFQHLQKTINFYHFQNNLLLLL